jgi:glutathione S-transferase
MSDKGKADAAELVRIAEALVAPGKPTMFGEYCIADTDLALALMRLVANQDPVPQPLVDYTRAQWSRESVQKYVTYAARASTSR